MSESDPPAGQVPSPPPPPAGDAPVPPPPPAGDDDRVDRETFRALLASPTPAVWGLLLLISGVFLAQIAHMAAATGRLPSFFFVVAPRYLVPLGGFQRALVVEGDLLRFASAILLHGGTIHFLINGLVLWNLGRYNERLQGTTSFLALFGVTGLAGTLGTLLGGTAHVSIGSSGAIFGLVGGLISFSVRDRDLLPEGVGKRVAWSLGGQATFWIVLMIGANQVMPMLGVPILIDNAAHIGGLLVGLALGWFLPSRLRAPRAGRTAIWARRILAGLGVVVVLAGLGRVGLGFAREPAEVPMETRRHEELGLSIDVPAIWEETERGETHRQFARGRMGYEVQPRASFGPARQPLEDLLRVVLDRMRASDDPELTVLRVEETMEIDGRPAAAIFAGVGPGGDSHEFARVLVVDDDRVVTIYFNYPAGDEEARDEVRRIARSLRFEDGGGAPPDDDAEGTSP